jgi:hypothetical protein
LLQDWDKKWKVESGKVEIPISHAPSLVVGTTALLLVQYKQYEVSTTALLLVQYKQYEVSTTVLLLVQYKQYEVGTTALLLVQYKQYEVTGAASASYASYRSDSIYVESSL